MGLGLVGTVVTRWRGLKELVREVRRNDTARKWEGGGGHSDDAEVLGRTPSPKQTHLTHIDKLNDNAPWAVPSFFVYREQSVASGEHRNPFVISGEHWIVRLL